MWPKGMSGPVLFFYVLFRRASEGRGGEKREIPRKRELHEPYENKMAASTTTTMESRMTYDSRQDTGL